MAYAEKNTKPTGDIFLLPLYSAKSDFTNAQIIADQSRLKVLMGRLGDLIGRR